MPSELLLPIREVARLTGVNPVTLRAWERRYGLLTPQRTEKGHRLYSQTQIERVQAVLHWLQRGASVSQVRGLLDAQPAAITPPQGDWQPRCQQLVDAIGNLAQRPLDHLFNQAVALYPAVTVCEHLLLPLLDQLAERWRTRFNARLEQVFFHSWLRSKLGTRVHHNNHSLEGPAVLLASDNDQPFDSHLWLCAWLLSNSGFPVEILEWSVSGAQLHEAVLQLKPSAVLLCVGQKIDARALQRALRPLQLPTLIGGPALSVHRDQLQALELPNLHLFDSPQMALQRLQQS
ncbi:MerR family transcriptional regulator [Pseudomonas capeferrum]|uniref:MerR family transcriptional regulator n=1 Tax=Pseudomonas capeferrum TaxID=1495066 RepID=UPI0015E47A9A|nr:MerR family transcriptional regulator [Pseudomonas capeferrum]MBA1201963.1 MerR family transcriptional regulator [Pseudomonas capeferrum]